MNGEVVELVGVVSIEATTAQARIILRALERETRILGDGSEEYETLQSMCLLLEDAVLEAERINRLAQVPIKVLDLRERGSGH
jgi:hypothetical protein